MHKTIIFSRFIFSPFFCPVKYFYLTLKKVSHGLNEPASTILLFIDLSSCLKRSFSLVGSFPSFLLPLSLLVSFPLFLYPPVPSFHPKRKAIFLVNLSYGNKKKITPLLAPPYTPPQNFGGMSGFPPRIFSPFFRGYPTPSDFFPFFPWWHYFHGLYFVNPKSPVCACDVGISLSNSHSLEYSA